MKTKKSLTAFSWILAILTALSSAILIFQEGFIPAVGTAQHVKDFLKAFIWWLTFLALPLSVLFSFLGAWFGIRKPQSNQPGRFILQGSFFLMAAGSFLVPSLLNLGIDFFFDIPAVQHRYYDLSPLTAPIAVAQLGWGLYLLLRFRKEGAPLRKDGTPLQWDRTVALAGVSLFLVLVESTPNALYFSGDPGIRSSYLYARVVAAPGFSLSFLLNLGAAYCALRYVWTHRKWARMSAGVALILSALVVPLSWTKEGLSYVWNHFDSVYGCEPLSPVIALCQLSLGLFALLGCRSKDTH